MSDQEARPKGALLVAGILLFGAVMMVVYWVLFFSGLPALSVVQCYMTFQQAFPLADAWLAAASLLGSIGLLRRKSWGVLFSVLAGSSWVYLGLMDVLFDLENGVYMKLYSPAGTEVAVEIAINILSLTLSPTIIWYIWSRRRSLL